MTDFDSERLPEDHEDAKILAQQVLRQGIADYISLGFAHRRKEHINQLNWLTAYSFLFDDDYELQNILNEDGTHATLKDILGYSGREHISLKDFRRNLKLHASTRWESQLPSEVPHVVNITGVPWIISPGKREVDYIENIIYCNNRHELLLALTEIAAYISEAPITEEETAELGEILIQTLQQNGLLQ